MSGIVKSIYICYDYEIYEYISQIYTRSPKIWLTFIGFLSKWKILSLILRHPHNNIIITTIAVVFLNLAYMFSFTWSFLASFTPPKKPGMLSESEKLRRFELRPGDHNTAPNHPMLQYTYAVPVDDRPLRSMQQQVVRLKWYIWHEVNHDSGP